ncbi:hypothetical protein ACP4OV_027848 [Aristida adscensionis]
MAALFSRAPRAALQVQGQGRELRRRRKMAVARLGGESSGRPRRIGAATLRRLRLRWAAALCRRAARQLRDAYGAAVRDVLEGAALVGSARADAGV